MADYNNRANNFLNHPVVILACMFGLLVMVGMRMLDGWAATPFLGLGVYGLYRSWQKRKQ